MNDVLKQIDRDTVVPPPDPRREAALLKAFDSPRHHSPIAAVAIAATVAVVVIGLGTLRNSPPAPLEAEPETSEFYIWPGAELLPRFESGQLIRTDVPVSELDLPTFRSAPPGAMVSADVLIGQDGLPRAYRVVFTSQTENQQ